MNWKTLTPDHDKLGSWEFYAKALMIELRQSLEEGLDVEQYRDLFNAVQQMPDTDVKARMSDLIYELVLNAPQQAEFAYEEPSDLAGILALCKGVKAPQKAEIDVEKLKQQIRGAWLGRIAGCLLGKPIEGIRTNELHPLLKESGNWPMHRYILSADVTQKMRDTFDYEFEYTCFADNIECAPADDDTNYTVMAQVMIDKFGRDFTTDHVAQTWVECQPKYAYCTAERVAFRNFVMGFRPPKSAVYKNPYREWIGAQIRADYYGYINPGDPAAAAEMAWRDAGISHVKNGIYGEMFVAAMIAQAAVENDIEKIIRTGMDFIPHTSRLYESLEKVVDAWKKGLSKEECMGIIRERWNEHLTHDWCHTISNAMIVAACLLYGGGDFAASICMAVQEGFDTDCNGATVGSILGMRAGADTIPPYWLEPVHGMLDTQIFGVGRVSIEEVAEKTMAHIVL